MPRGTRCARISRCAAGSAASEQVRQALNTSPEANYSLEELSIAEASDGLPADMRERLRRGERGRVPESE